MNTGDTAFLLMVSALVLPMTPGLAFLYGGLVGDIWMRESMMSNTARKHTT